MHSHVEKLNIMFIMCATPCVKKFKHPAVVDVITKYIVNFSYIVLETNTN